MRGIPSRGVLASLVVMGLAVPAAADFTVATFQDPAIGTNSDKSMFTVTDSTVSGGWNYGGLGLTFWDNVTRPVDMSMTTLVRTDSNDLQGGEFDFTDPTSHASIFKITFDSAWIDESQWTLTGQNDIYANGVKFYLYNHELTNLSSQYFDFELGPHGATADTRYYNASFTSSAEGKLPPNSSPEPFTLVLGAAAFAVGVGRRRMRKA